MFSDGARTLRDHRIERGPGRVRQTLSRRSRCSKSTCSNAPRGQKFARSCTSVSQPARSSRTQRCCQGARSAADRRFDVGQTTRGLPGSPALAGHASRTGVEGSAHRDHGALLPRQHFRTPGSGARRGLRRNNVATRPGPTKRPAPKNRGLVAQRADPCYKPIDPFPSRCCATGPIICGILITQPGTDYLGSPQSWAATVSATAAGEVTSEI